MGKVTRAVVSVPSAFHSCGEVGLHQVRVQLRVPRPDAYGRLEAHDGVGGIALGELQPGCLLDGLYVARLLPDNLLELGQGLGEFMVLGEQAGPGQTDGQQIRRSRRSGPRSFRASSSRSRAMAARASTRVRRVFL